MARVPLLEYGDAPPEVQKIYDGQKAAVGKTFSTTQIRGHCPELLKGISAMQASQGKSAFAPAELKPLLTLLVSRLNECPH